MCSGFFVCNFVRNLFRFTINHFFVLKPSIVWVYPVIHTGQPLRHIPTGETTQNNRSSLCNRPCNRLNFGHFSIPGCMVNSFSVVICAKCQSAKPGTHCDTGQTTSRKSHCNHRKTTCAKRPHQLFVFLEFFPTNRPPSFFLCLYPLCKLNCNQRKCRYAPENCK